MTLKTSTQTIKDFLKKSFGSFSNALKSFSWWPMALKGLCNKMFPIITINGKIITIS